MHSPSLARYAELLDRGDWQGVGGLMLDSAERLARAGADFLICPDNTIHRALPDVERRSPLPWLHIAEAVVAEAAARGYRKVGIMGTRWLVESDVYPEKITQRGLEYMRPGIEDRETMHRIIMDELVYGAFKPESVARLQQSIASLKENGCDAVILGCTEFPLVLDDSNAPLPMLDSTRLLARVALRRAVSDAASPAS
jgi:aspartate racemase